ncbi:S-formylglutathione hydrolase [Pseudoruegeria sp. SK021]|uniref:S-formylglutathione hydrolase n=1 Tax=Pseudoruegeria sp. SK021 TaxID=1933035 RepID=UPI000A22981F|nr:S-formylglutathione hydrolase [Pseudoruegeria sp. SK021]OSP56786.1 S-formylglutathione hydrolase [Pseudoruegeria sp. SK021]
MEIISETRSYGGIQGVYCHPSDVCACDMTFGLFIPPAATLKPVPLLWYLSGLTCTHANAMEKAGAQAHAAKHGFALVLPDTSPRGAAVANDPGFDLGQGAGFYVNAVQDPWKAHYRMWDYIVDELPLLLAAHFPLDMTRQSISGHSMGGHGALTIAMAHPERFQSVSAFAPISHPSRSRWGRKQFMAYLGTEESDWAKHDSSLQMRDVGFDGPVLIDQGGADQFLDLLMPEALAQAMFKRRQNGQFRLHPGYDHSYYFISSFFEDHAQFHADAFSAVPA